ncbi:uncharacterized protein UHOD_05870 [Ustilago sp. UG-2017b]|nr:uncharacterized protein UHOD_05870 [Ustilago sp. UG-2017b]
MCFRLVDCKAMKSSALGLRTEADGGYCWAERLMCMRLLSNGTLRVVHFDNKAAIDNYAESLRGDKIDVSYFHAAILVQNFTEQLRKGEHGSLSITLPHGAASHFTDQFVLRPDPRWRLP